MFLMCFICFFAHDSEMRERMTGRVFVMLVLGRNLGQSIVIKGNIAITFFKGLGDDLKIAIDAPKEIKIVRGESVRTSRKQEATAAFLEG